MGRAGGGGPGWGPPPALLLLLLLGATLVLPAGAVPAREAGSAIEAEELVRSGLAWEPRANDTREEAGLPAAGEDETSWRAPGRELAAVGPGVGPEEALEASAAVTGTAWLEADSPGLGGVTAETGSGDAQTLPATLQAPDEAHGSSTMPPAIPEATEASGPPSPTTHDKPSPGSELPESPLEVWLNLGGSTPDPQGPEPTYPLQGTLETQPASDIIDMDYFEGLDSEGHGTDMGSFPGSPGTSENHPDTEGETPSWSLLDLYDDFTPFDESDFYPTTSFYDDLEEEEEEEEDDKGAVGGGDLEDENDLLLPSQKPGVGPGTGQPTSRWHAVPPQHTLGMVPGSSISLRPRPGDPGRDLASGENGTECRVGFVRHNGSCRSVCDLFPSYCHNGGQCYLVENIGAFCRCNTQDYIWHKGMRCESIITDFQVMCVAVGSAALVLLLLFMMTVFFAKKLYLLKTENTKLRRTNKFRTPSELHNDNFSLSTIAEGSHPNVRKLCDTPCVSSPHARALAHYDNIVCQDDPSAPHKIQEALKSCLKEEESFNIQNSMSPKLEGGKGDQADLEVNCLQNNLT
uniref:Chondroitin sulfate proteoglycan 5 n=1 Tax=Cricetulus griseus TaxID=10029 RepID=A0A8C2LMP9_CRIGR